MADQGRFETRTGPIRLGMVGGGNDAFIGGVHRIASRIDDKYRLVAGALSSTPAKAQASVEALGLAADRIYDDYKQMAIREARLKDGIEAVAIVTPNHVHHAAAREFLKRGIHVICDKPLTSTLQDAKKYQLPRFKSYCWRGCICRFFVIPAAASGQPCSVLCADATCFISSAIILCISSYSLLLLFSAPRSHSTRSGVRGSAQQASRGDASLADDVNLCFSYCSPIPHCPLHQNNGVDSPHENVYIYICIYIYAMITIIRDPAFSFGKLDVLNIEESKQFSKPNGYF